VTAGKRSGVYENWLVPDVLIVRRV